MLDLLRRKREEERPAVELLKAAVGNLNKLPMLPEAASAAIKIANNANSSLRDLAAVVERDPALAAGTLKLVNSSLYWAGRPIESIEEAVVRLGLRECQNLIIAVSMRSLFSSATLTGKQRCEVLWTHSFITALLCRALNQRLGLGYRGEEFSCGLSHDIGRILFSIGAPQAAQTADPMDFQEGPDVLDQEREVLGTDHCEFGAWFADINQLPGTLISAIQYHHFPTRAGDYKRLIGLVAVGDHMANHMQREAGAAGYDPDANSGWMAAAADWPEERKRKFVTLAPALMEEAAKEAEELVQIAAA